MKQSYYALSALIIIVLATLLWTRKKYGQNAFAKAAPLSSIDGEECDVITGDEDQEDIEIIEEDELVDFSKPSFDVPDQFGIVPKKKGVGNSISQTLGKNTQNDILGEGRKTQNTLERGSGFDVNYTDVFKPQAAVGKPPWILRPKSAASSMIARGKRAIPVRNVVIQTNTNKSDVARNAVMRQAEVAREAVRTQSQFRTAWTGQNEGAVKAPKNSAAAMNQYKDFMKIEKPAHPSTLPLFETQKGGQINNREAFTDKKIRGFASAGMRDPRNENLTERGVSNPDTLSGRTVQSFARTFESVKPRQRNIQYVYDKEQANMPADGPQAHRETFGFKDQEKPIIKLALDEGDSSSHVVQDKNFRGITPFYKGNYPTESNMGYQFNDDGRNDLQEGRAKRMIVHETEGIPKTIDSFSVVGKGAENGMGKRQKVLGSVRKNFEFLPGELDPAGGTKTRDPLTSIRNAPRHIRPGQPQVRF